MITTRDLCRVLSATLHIPDIERWAEQLVSRELLPGMDRKVYGLDAALLLAGVVAAPRPEDAPHAIATLASLPRLSTMCRVDGPEIENWARGTDADVAAMPDDPLDALATAIEQGPFPDNRFFFTSLKIEESGGSAELLGCLGDDLQFCRAQYYLPGSGLTSGLTRIAEIHSDVIGAVATEMWPPPAEQTVSRYERALVVH